MTSSPDARGSGSDRDDSTVPPTASKAYADRLTTLAGARWKRRLHVQAPWHAQLRLLRLGRTLDIGCGTGRNLRFLDSGSVGVDHNSFSVEAARAIGCRAVTTKEFIDDPSLNEIGGFDSLLASHLIEHLRESEAREIVGAYLPYVKRGGRVIFMTPQERGYDSDPTHVTFTGFEELSQLVSDLGLETIRRYSFPFPRVAGRLFTYNEFVVIARVP